MPTVLDVIYQLYALYAN